MKFLLRTIGRLYTLAGLILACLAIVVLLSSINFPKIPADFLDPLLTKLAAIAGNSFSTMDPDEHVYDYTLGANVPRVYILRIPKINLEAPVVRVEEREIQIESNVVTQIYVPHSFAVGWNENSAPVGNYGNTVFVGHNNIYGEVFKDLWNLQSGDEIVVQTGSGDRSYLVSRVITLDESSLPIHERSENASWIRWTPHEQLTLVTCFPYSSNTHRLIVVAYPS